MATIDVKDAAGNTVALEKPLTPGQAASSASRPVALSTENMAALASQTTLAALLAKVIAAPSTEAKQDAIVALLTIQAGYLDGVETALGLLGSQTTLAAVLAKLTADPATQTTLAAVLSALGSPMQSSGGSVGHNVTGLTDGRKVVASAGTAVALAASTAAKAVEIIAETDNTGYIVVGASTVVAALATRRGKPLAAGESTGPIPCDNLAYHFIDATVTGDGVTFLYWT